MPDAIAADAFLQPFAFLWEEVIGDPPKGGKPVAVLDPDTGWTQTLAALNAVEASRPVVPGGTTVAGQTAHAAYYLELLLAIIEGRRVEADWPGSFRPSEVDESAWTAQKARLFAAARRVAEHVHAAPDWPEAHLRSALGALVHLAYHLGAVRQMARVVRG